MPFLLPQLLIALSFFWPVLDAVAKMAPFAVVDTVWTGAPTGFGAIEAHDKIYVAYYDASRRLTVAAIDEKTGMVRRKALENTFEGWDTHHFLVLTMDGGRYLHVAGNMHATPLVYARMTRPEELDSLRLIPSMVGSDEEYTTYPAFLNTKQGDLVFMYRSGHDEEGKTLLNVWNGKAWRRLFSQPLFAYSRSRYYSAYPTLPTPDAQGVYHMAWVWRGSTDVRTNCCLSYARSKDLRSWEDSHGDPVPLPIAPGKGDPVDRISVDSGLLNQVQIGFDFRNRPIVTYIKYDADGHTQLYNARLEDRGWAVHQASRWHDRWTLEGGGSIPRLISYSPVHVGDDGLLHQTGHHWKEGDYRFALDPETLEPCADAACNGRTLTMRNTRPPPEQGIDKTPRTSGWAVHTLRVMDAEGKATSYMLRWETQPSNRDRPRACTTEAPRACDPPPAPLELYELR